MICTKCKKRKAEIDYTRSVLDYTHGNYQRICKLCCIEILEDNLKSIKKRIKELRKHKGGKRK